MISESASRVDVFFYGLFMDTALLNQKSCAPTNERIAAVHGFVLRIGQRATLVPHPNQSVYGVVMSLSRKELNLLYSEPSVSIYRPEAVVAQLSSGEQIPALCYTLPIPPTADEHNAEYAAKLKALAQQLGLPADYVASIG